MTPKSTEPSTPTVQVQQLINQVIASWTAQNKAVTDLFMLYGDDYYLNEVAPARNRGVYLLGHLIVASDGMLPLLGFGDRSYPELVSQFSTNPDRSVEPLPSVNKLKEKWTALNEALSTHFSQIQPEAWQERHTNVSEEAFAFQPERNKLSILLSRTNHISYHTGQLIFLTKKNA